MVSKVLIAGIYIGGALAAPGLHVVRNSAGIQGIAEDRPSFWQTVTSALSQLSRPSNSSTTIQSSAAGDPPKNSGGRSGGVLGLFRPRPSPSSTPSASPAGGPSTIAPPEPALEIKNDGLWQPKVAAPFQIILSGAVDAGAKLVPDNVEIFDIDLFYTEKKDMDVLRKQGKKIICYFSAGTSEDWRADYKQFSQQDQGYKIAKNSAGTSFWPGEKWLNIRAQTSNPLPRYGNSSKSSNSTNSAGLSNVWRIMKERIRLAKEKGCDAIDPDNIDGYDNKNGLGLTRQDSIKYMKFMADEARHYNMSIGLKNSIGILPDVQNLIQFAVNEECALFNECSGYKQFLTKKPVFHIEYTKKSSSLFGQRVGNVQASEQEKYNRFCTPKNAPDLGPKFSTIIKVEALDGWVRFCDGKEAVTRVIRSPNDKGRFANS